MVAHHCGMNIMYACAPPLYGNHEEGRRRSSSPLTSIFSLFQPTFFSSFTSFTRSKSSYMFFPLSLSFFLLYLAGRAPAGQSPPSSPSWGGSVQLRRAGAALFLVRTYVGHWHSSSPFLIYREEEEEEKSVVSDLVSPLSHRKTDRAGWCYSFPRDWPTNKSTRSFFS